MEKKICKEFRDAEKHMNIKSLGADVHNEILKFITPCKVGDIWYPTFVYFDLMVVTRCTWDTVWLRDQNVDSEFPMENEMHGIYVYESRPTIFRRKIRRDKVRPIRFGGGRWAGLSVKIGYCVYRPIAEYFAPARLL